MQRTRRGTWDVGWKRWQQLCSELPQVGWQLALRSDTDIRLPEPYNGICRKLFRLSAAAPNQPIDKIRSSIGLARLMGPIASSRCLVTLEERDWHRLGVGPDALTPYQKSCSSGSLKDQQRAALPDGFLLSDMLSFLLLLP